MQIVGRGVDDRQCVAVPPARRSLRRELEALLTQGTAVEEQLHAVAVGVGQHRDHLPVPSRPVPVWEQVEHWLLGPLALVEVVGVLGVAGDVDGSGAEPFKGPRAFPEVVHAGPHEVAREVVVRRDPLPQPLGLHHPASVVGPHGHIAPQRVTLVPALEHRATLGADHLPLRMIVPILVGKNLPALMPAVHVVVADDVLSVEERQGRGVAVGVDLVVAGRHRSRRVLAMKNVHEAPQHLHALGCALFADLVPGAPEDNRRMVAVAAHEVRHVALGPCGEVLVIALGHLAAGPFVEGLGHHEKAQAIAQVEKLGGGRVVRSTDGVGAHRLQQPQALFPHPLRHGRAERAGVVVQIDAFHLHPHAVQEKPAVLVVGDAADAERRGDHVNTATVVHQLGAQRVQGGGLDRPEPRRVDRHSVLDLSILSRRE